MAALLLAALAASPVAGAAKGQDGPIATHIIVFNEGVDARDAAGSLASAHGLSVSNVYTHALSGMAAVVPAGRLNALANDPRVAFVEANQVVQAFPQELPTGINRANADDNATAKIDGIDGVDERVNVDIAILDTGIELTHPDLNIFKYANCARKGPMNTSCKEGDSGANDGYGHGTHVAGTAAALDNGIGVVGMAPGARLWAVKVLGNDGSGWMNWIIAGVDYVAKNKASIEVANMSLGCACSSFALDAAIANAVGKGVTFTVAAGNAISDAKYFSPANHPDVITVSAIADFDGVPGGKADQEVVFSICTEDKDDSFACFSNFGSLIEIAAPGVNILSTYLGGGTATMSGTSMASPHVAGGAALIKADNPTFNPAQVLAELLASGTANAYTGDPDKTVEPLLNVASGPPPTLATIAVTPTSASVAVGNTQQFTATGTYSDGSSSDITASVEWSSDAAAATIDSSGLATGVAQGSAGISASSDSETDSKTSNTAALIVTPPPALTSITISPASASIEAGGTQQFTATGTYDDASTADITADVTWTSSYEAVASIDSSGLATGAAEGSVVILASLVGVNSNTATLTVTPPPALTSITISPASATIQTGETQQFTATGGYDDGSSADITTSVAWSSDSAAASIDASGLASGLLEGSTAITAAQGDIVSGTASLDVTPAPEVGSEVGVTSITYATSGGKNGDKHLFITVSVADDLGNPVQNASVSIKLTNDTSGGPWTGIGTTGTGGAVTFKLGNAPDGCYSTVVTNISADGLIWDGVTGTADGSFCKSSGSNNKGNSGALQVQ